MQILSVSKTVENGKRIVAASRISEVVADLKKLPHGKGIAESGGGVTETVFAAEPIARKIEFADYRLFDADHRAVFRAEIAFRPDHRVKSAGDARSAGFFENAARIRVKHPRHAISRRFI